jgi:vacuolar protein sorting-associated protein 54
VVLYEQTQRLKERKDEASEGQITKSDGLRKVYESRDDPEQLHVTPNLFDASIALITQSTSLPRKGNTTPPPPPPSSIIPKIYFNKNFHLENPRIFDITTERSAVVSPPSTTKKPTKRNGLPPRKALAANTLLQEKIS